jgi:hypothetical protein
MLPEEDIDKQHDDEELEQEFPRSVIGLFI